MAKPGTPRAMLERIRSINLEDVAGDVLEQNLEKLAEINKDQLMQGKNNKGEILRPLHTENPFFKSPESAIRYAKWKQNLFPQTPFNVPNLIITGYYHGTISFSRRAAQITAQSNASFADKIDSTFDQTPLGLNQDSKNIVWEEFLRSGMIQLLAPKIGCDAS